MAHVASKVFRWFWTFSWIIMFIPFNFYITFGFTNLTWTTRIIPFMDNTQFKFVCKERSYISSFPHSIFVKFYLREFKVGTFLAFKVWWHSLLTTDSISFTIDLQKSKTLKTKYNQRWSSSVKKNIIKLWKRSLSDKRKVFDGWLPIAFH